MRRKTCRTPTDLPNTDYGAWYDHAEYSREGCFSSPTYTFVRIAMPFRQQQQADAGSTSWRFGSPKDVALSELRPQIETELTLLPTKVSPARIVFDGTAAGRRNRYFAVVSRPYWLTHDAADPRHVIWVLTAAYEYGCPEEPRR